MGPRAYRAQQHGCDQKSCKATFFDSPRAAGAQLHDLWWPIQKKKAKGPWSAGHRWLVVNTTARRESCLPVVKGFDLILLLRGPKYSTLSFSSSPSLSITSITNSQISSISHPIDSKFLKILPFSSISSHILNFASKISPNTLHPLSSSFNLNSPPFYPQFFIFLHKNPFSYFHFSFFAHYFSKTLQFDFVQLPLPWHLRRGQRPLKK